MSTPLNLHAAPAAGFDQPFEMLLACHERVHRMLALLLRLADHLAHHGADAQARQAAVDVMRYFDLAGPAHHEDEERHLFPLLSAQGGPDAAALVQRLHADHVAMTLQWQAVRGDLQAAADGAWLPAQAPSARARWTAFAALYAGHIGAEENLAYPAARGLLAPAALQAMGREMAARRGAVLPG
jgi:hemerythrin-like domain-containing protein